MTNTANIRSIGAFTMLFGTGGAFASMLGLVVAMAPVVTAMG